MDITIFENQETPKCPIVYDCDPSLKMELLNAKQLSNYLGISMQRTYKLLKVGEIKGFRIGHSWRTTRADLLEYVNNRSHHY